MIARSLDTAMTIWGGRRNTEFYSLLWPFQHENGHPWWTNCPATSQKSSLLEMYHVLSKMSTNMYNQHLTHQLELRRRIRYPSHRFLHCGTLHACHSNTCLRGRNAGEPLLKPPGEKQQSMPEMLCDKVTPFSHIQGVPPHLLPSPLQVGERQIAA